MEGVGLLSSVEKRAMTGLKEERCRRTSQGALTHGRGKQGLRMGIDVSEEGRVLSLFAERWNLSLQEHQTMRSSCCYDGLVSRWCEDGELRTDVRGRVGEGGSRARLA